MIDSKPLVLDANILIRAVLGTRTRQILTAYEETVGFCCPDICFQDARRHIGILGERRGFDASDELALLDEFSLLLETVDRSAYDALEPQARERIASRDPDDWPLVATALLLNAPIWTEDQDFFGCGIAVWTSDRVEIFFRD